MGCHRIESSCDIRHHWGPFQRDPCELALGAQSGAMKSPFDPIQACFYLVATVIGAHLVVVLMGTVICALHAQEIVASGKECPAGNRLTEVLGAALAAALAFAGGKSRGE
jgi:hypothetical protein